jgi:hypothetical protein
MTISPHDYEIGLPPSRFRNQSSSGIVFAIYDAMEGGLNTVVL